MLKVGLTGGIATGKSFVSEVLRELGCEVADADKIAHQVIEPGRPAYHDIVRKFSHDVPDLLREDSTINRATLGAYVFQHPARLQQLNAIVHPRVFETQERWFAEIAAQNPEAIAVVDAALMIETGSYKRFDKLVVVHCEPELQLTRLMTRNNLSRTTAQERIAAQMPSTEKLAYADYSIDTSSGFDDTRRQVEAVYRQLRNINSRHLPDSAVADE